MTSWTIIMRGFAVDSAPTFSKNLAPSSAAVHAPKLSTMTTSMTTTTMMSNDEMKRRGAVGDTKSRPKRRGVKFVKVFSI
jgi:hypothetical protein